MNDTGSPAASVDLLVVGAGPTGLAIGAEALRAGLTTLVVDRGAITQALQEFPTDMTFFSTRERLAIAGIPFSIPEERPTRRQALAYYRSVAEALRIPLALHEEVTAIRKDGEGFAVTTRGRGGDRVRRSRAVAIAIGYFDTPRRLGVPGEEPPAVRHRYREPYAHYRERVVVVGGGNSAAEAALDLWRAGA
ncbi:MAG TPA: NAD(P)-binding domain-containing protein, partial [Thermoanaerobaculia bacterium]|nr:NAD(P)-binding domain-containing protein [Thermoanaerobaculia bacterium]